MIELPTFEFMVMHCKDGVMIVYNKYGTKKIFNKLDKLIEIDLIQKCLEAKKRGGICLIKMAIEPGFNKIVEIKIE